MSPARRMVVLTALLGCVANLRDARACSQDPISAIRGFVVLPADGADDVPTNTRIWVSSMRGYETLPPSAFSVERAGVSVPVRRTEIAVSGEQVEALYVLEPTITLAPGDTLDVFVSDGSASPQRLARFRIGPSADTLAPALPELDGIDVTGAAYGGYSCGSSSTVEIEVRPISELLFMVGDDDTGTALPARALAVSADGRAIGYELGAGERTFRYLAVDLAGNTSERSDPITVTIPAKVSGCNASGGAGGWAFVLVGALGCRGRRRPTRPAGVTRARTCRET